jgi:hypothetical protein
VTPIRHRESSQATESGVLALDTCRPILFGPLWSVLSRLSLWVWIHENHWLKPARGWVSHEVARMDFEISYSDRQDPVCNWAVC